jgi:hypothetical protein
MAGKQPADVDNAEQGTAALQGINQSVVQTLLLGEVSIWSNVVLAVHNSIKRTLHVCHCNESSVESPCANRSD